MKCLLTLFCMGLCLAGAILVPAEILIHAIL